MKRFGLISALVFCGVLCVAPMAFSLNLLQFFFETSTGTLFAIIEDSGARKFASLNPDTGVVTAIVTFGSEYLLDQKLNDWTDVASCINSTNHKVYVPRKDTDGSWHILTITTAGAVSVGTALHF